MLEHFTEVGWHAIDDQKAIPYIDEGILNKYTIKGFFEAPIEFFNGAFEIRIPLIAIFFGYMRPWLV